MFQQFVTNKTGYDKLPDGYSAEDDAEDDAEKEQLIKPVQIVIKEDNEKIPCDITDWIVIIIFWSALLLNSLAQLFANSEEIWTINDETNNETNNETKIRRVLETIASVLYGVNIFFLIYQGIPGINDSVLRGRCCSCSCRSREYAIGSAVLFAFSIGSTISSFVYLG